MPRSFQAKTTYSVPLRAVRFLIRAEGGVRLGIDGAGGIVGKVVPVGGGEVVLVAGGDVVAVVDGEEEGGTVLLEEGAVLLED